MNIDVDPPSHLYQPIDTHSSSPSSLNSFIPHLTPLVRFIKTIEGCSTIPKSPKPPWKYSHVFLVGDVHRYKVKLVARDFNQILGVDYGNTISPIVKINSIRVLLTLATQHNLEIH